MTDVNSTLSSTEKATLYRWLGFLFQRECDENVLNWYRSEAGLAFLSFLSSFPFLATGAEKIRNIVCSDETADEVILKLAGSFSGLFYGINPAQAAPPYESCYRDERGLLFGEASKQMDILLSRHDLKLDGFAEPADHIAVQLHLMAHLSNDIVAQTELLHDHLGQWVDEFGENCIRFDRSGFYAGAAEILMAFLEQERQGA